MKIQTKKKNSKALKNATKRMNVAVLQELIHKALVPHEVD